MRISAGSAGALATDADVLCLCVIRFGGPIILPLLDRLFTLSKWMVKWLAQATVNSKIRTRTDPSDGRNGWATLHSLSFSFVQFSFFYWYHKNSTLLLIATSSSPQLSSITSGF
jgi:hypothetical protein